MGAERSKKRTVIVFAIVAALLLTAVSANIIAKYIKGSPAQENTLKAGEYDAPSVSDNVDSEGGMFFKNNVAVTVGDEGYPVYVRADLIVTWHTSGGYIYGQQPVEGTDYTLEYNTDDWTKGDDGWFYYTEAVQSGGTTAPLIGQTQKLSQIKAAPEGCTMHVEVITETIQALGSTDDGSKTAVMDAWGTQPDDQQTEGGQP
ncbi:MAG: hypothetical protein GXY08_11595 [Ruminococcus sp.]|nr:hypothetical protein [Ruminococcus sp.]